MAEAIEQQEATSPGSTPGILRRAIDTWLGRQPDPFEILKALVARSVASLIGTDDYTYRRMSRRQPANCGRMRGVVRLAPECAVIVDTSGSMSPYIHRAATAVAQGMRRVHRPRVICFDTEAQSDRRLSSLSQFSWDGGGGTRMDQAIEYADTLKADCIVCAQGVRVRAAAESLATAANDRPGKSRQVRQVSPLPQETPGKTAHRSVIGGVPGGIWCPGSGSGQVIHTKGQA